MTVHLPLLVLLALVGLIALKAYHLPKWLAALLLLGGFLLGDTVLAGPIESGTRTGVDIVNTTTK